MKINKIEIDNFGTLKDKTYDLTNGLNYICEVNGFGKTTLGAFIKVMFYGFDKEKSKVSERERTKYKPWQGGIYGGTIEFEANGKEYVLRRLFKDKQSDDKTVLRDKKTNIESNDFDVDNLGKELFNIDANSFTRTMFLSQNEYDLSSFNDIDSKIGNMVDNTDDMNNFETAIEALESKINLLSKSRKPYGQIENNEDKIQQLKQDVKEKPSIESSIKKVSLDLDDANENIAELTEKKKEIESKLQMIGNKKDAATKKKEYDILLQQKDNEYKNLEKLLEYFNNLEPNNEEIESYESKLTEIEKNKTLLNENTLSEEEKVLQARLNEIFKNTEVTNSEFEDMQNLLTEQTKLKNAIGNLSLSKNEADTLVKYSSIFHKPFNAEKNEELINLWNGEREQKRRTIDSLSLSYTEKEKLKNLNSQFNGKELNEDKVNSYINRLSDNRALVELSELKNQLLIEQTKSESKPNIVGIIIMLVLMVVGTAAAFAFNKSIIGLVFASIGIAIMAITTISSNSRINAIKINKINELNEIIEEKENEIKQLKNSAILLLREYGVNCDAGYIAFELNNLKSNYAQFKDLMFKQKELELQQQDYKQRILEIENTIYKYLNCYGLVADETNALPLLHELQTKHDTYVSLKKKNDSLELVDNKKKFHSNIEKITAFFSKFGFVEVKEEDYFNKLNGLASSIKRKAELNKKAENYNQIKLVVEQLNKEVVEFFVKYGKIGQFNWNNTLNEMQSQSTLYCATKQKCIELNNKQKDFEDNNPDYINFSIISEEIDDVSLEELTTQSAKLQEEIDEWKEDKDEYSDNLTVLNDKFNELCDKEGEIESLTLTNNELNERLNILKQAHKHLTEAKESLNSKYGSPITESLSKYFGKLAKNADFDISIDANKQIIVSAQGAERDLRNLSKGYSDIVDICFRMSLTDAMYQEEKPLIILDDPFINLDEEKIVSGLKFLKEIGKNYQILYLTCHQSRMPKQGQE